MDFLVADIGNVSNLEQRIYKRLLLINSERLFVGKRKNKKEKKVLHTHRLPMNESITTGLVYCFHSFI